ncbi:hypothetical protein MN608_03198 [Microdochium nivale]|nr:hypothetical protein MN608_03198 [Microdochium nivale]
MEKTINKKREQNKIAQRTHRFKMRQKIAELERKVEEQAEQLAARPVLDCRTVEGTMHVNSLFPEPQALMPPTPALSVSYASGTTMAARAGKADQLQPTTLEELAGSVAAGTLSSGRSSQGHSPSHPSVIQEQPPLQEDSCDSTGLNFDWGTQFPNSRHTGPSMVTLTYRGLAEEGLLSLGASDRDHNGSLLCRCGDLRSNAATAVVDGEVLPTFLHSGRHGELEADRDSTASRLNYLLCCMVACGFNSFEEMTASYYEVPFLDTPDPNLRLREARMDNFPSLIQRIISRKFYP